VGCALALPEGRPSEVKLLNDRQALLRIQEENVATQEESRRDHANAFTQRRHVPHPGENKKAWK
jgi:hypothetical protein